MRPSFDIGGMVLDQQQQATVESYLNRLMKAEKYRIEGDMDHATAELRNYMKVEGSVDI